METTHIKRDELLNILKSNIASHTAKVNEAIEERKISINKRMPELLEEFNAGTNNLSSIKFPEPIDNSKEYTRIIRMVELDVRDEIELSHTQFQEWVMDEWTFNNLLNSTSAFYKSTL